MAAVLGELQMSPNGGSISEDSLPRNYNIRERMANRFEAGGMRSEQVQIEGHG